MADRTRRSAGLMILDIFLQFLPGFMLYHCIAAAGEILFQAKDCFSLWNGWWLFLLTAGLYLFRCYLTDFRFFLAAHLICLVIFCAVLPRTVFSKVVLTGIGAFRGLYGSIQKASRMNERGEKVDLNKVDVEATDPKEGCVALLSLLIALPAGDMTVIYSFLLEPILFYLAYLFRTHLSGRRMYLEQYEHMSHFPVKHMKQTGYLVMGTYMLIGTVCFAAAASYRYLLSDTGPFIWFWEKIKQVLYFLGSLIGKVLQIFETDIPEETAAEAVEEAPSMFPGGTAGPSAFWMTMEEILRVGVFIVLVVLLIAGLVYILLEWNRRFQGGKKSGDQVEEYEEIRESWKRKEKQARRWRGTWFQTPEEKIRRIYIREIRNARRMKQPEMSIDRLKRLPPSELDQSVFLDQIVEDEEALRTFYEQARYSGKGVEKETVVQAKAAAGRKKNRYL